MTIRVAHVIAGLPVGGAERTLLALSDKGRDAGLASSVICLAPKGPVSEELREAGIPVYHLGLESPWRFPLAAAALRRQLCALDPDVIQGWMYHGNLAALLAGRGLRAPVAWNIRQSLHRMDLFKMTTRMIIHANAALSGRVGSAIYNSGLARRQHEAMGFHAGIGVCIPNGVDTDRFVAGCADRTRLRESFGLSSADFVIASVGRAHPIKGHDILMRCVATVASAHPEVRFLVAGEGCQWERDPFRAFAREPLVRERVILAGARDDVANLLSVADLFVSPSRTEGFPNSVAEAMAASLPCVVTDVGDSAMLVGSSGGVVAAGDADSLAAGIVDLVQASPATRREMGASARKRVQSEFSMDRMVQRYADLYRALVR